MPTEHREATTARPRRAVVWGLGLVAAGGLWLAHLLGAELRWDVILPVGLVVVGVGVLFSRRPGGDGLIGLGVVLAVVAVSVVLAPIPLSLGIGERDHRPTSVAELDDAATLGIGSLTLDLRGVELPAGRTEATARVSIGELVVRVPRDVTVEGHARAGIGEVDVDGNTSGGLGARRDVALSGPPGAPVLELDLRVGLGSVKVVR